MKVSIIPVDKTVCKDGICYNNLEWQGTPDGVHALQWIEVSGWIEFDDDTKPNEDITVLPDWANNALAAWDFANQPKPVEPPTAAQNKKTARSLLYTTDWATIPDITDPANTPYLLNQGDFIAYRNTIRKIAVNPIPGYLDWGTIPTAQWST